MTDGSCSSDGTQTRHPMIVKSSDTVTMEQDHMDDTFSREHPNLSETANVSLDTPPRATPFGTSEKGTTLTPNDRQHAPVHIGDQILLYDHQVDGYMRSGLSCVKGGVLSIRSNSKYEDQSSDDTSLGTSQMVFQLQCAERYKMTKKFMKLKTHNKSDTHQEHIISSVQSELYDLARSEVDDNNDMQLRQFGEALYYGQSIQILHSRSKRQVEVDQEIVSELDSENMRVNLNTKLCRNITFTILPGYKVRAVGEQVRQNDKVIFESNKVPGYFLRTSTSTFGPKTVMSNENEVSLSVTPTAYTLKVFCSASDNDPPEKMESPVLLQPFVPFYSQEALTVRGGDVVQLFHRELDAYISAEKSASPHTVVSEDVHLRVRLPDPERPNRLNPPTSAVSFWTLEHTDCQSGSNILHRSKVRIRHVVTQLFLTMHPHKTLDEESVTGKDDTREFCLTLTDNINDANNVFKLHSVQGSSVRESDPVGNATMVRIEHVNSACWIHGAKSVKYHRKRSTGIAIEDSFSKRLSNMEWDHAPLLNVSLVNEEIFQDAFKIQKVASSLVDNAYVVTDSVAVLNHYCRERLTRRLTTTETDRVVETLQNIREFMYDNKMPQKQRQKLLRNCCIVDTLVLMLRVPFIPYNTSVVGIELKDLHTDGSTNLIIENIFLVLKGYLDGNSRKNELYAARHIGLFFTLLGGYMDVEPLLIEMIRDNREIIDQFTEKEIKTIIDFVTNGKRDPDFLELIAVLCECDGVPLRMNQTRATALLLNGKTQVFYRSKYTNTRQTVEVSSDKGSSWYNIHSFGSQHASSKTEDSGCSIHWLEKQLYLLAKLCRGRFDFAIDRVVNSENLVDMDVCFYCASQEDLPMSLRTAYVELMIAAFVDIDPHKTISDPLFCQDWTVLDTNTTIVPEGFVSSHGAISNFSDLSEWIISVLQSKNSLVVDNTDDNVYVCAVLQLLRYLIKFGYYITPAQMKSMTPRLLALIDGRDDIEYPAHHKATNEQQDLSRGSARFHASFKNEITLAVKHEALCILECLQEITHKYKLKRVLADFKFIQAWNPQHTFSGPMSNKCALVLKEMVTAEIREGGDVHRTSVTIVRDYLSDVHNQFDWSGSNNTLHGNRFQENKEYVVDVLFDLARYRFSHSLSKSLLLLTRMHFGSEDLMQDALKVQLLCSKESVDFSATLRNLVDVVQKLRKGYIEDGESDNYIKVLQFFRSKCAKAAPSNTDQELNQKMLCNAGVLSMLLDIVDYNGGQSSKVLMETFKTMQVLVRNNEEAQTLMFVKVDMVLACKSKGTGWQNAMAGALTSMLVGHESNCFKITNTHIKQMTTILAEYGTKVPNMIQAMQASITPNGTIYIKRNQRNIVKALAERCGPCLHPVGLMVSDAHRQIETVVDLVRGEIKNGGVATSAQTYHFNMISLICACAKKSNRYVESTCRAMLPVEAVLHVLSVPDLASATRLRYLDYLRWVFLERNDTKRSAVHLHADVRLFQALVLCGRHDLEAGGVQSVHVPSGDACSTTCDVYLPIVSLVLQNHFNSSNKSQAFDLMKIICVHASKMVETIVGCVHDVTHAQAIRTYLKLVPDHFTGINKDIESADLMRAMQRAQTKGTPSAAPPTAPEQAIQAKAAKYFRNLLTALQGPNTVGGQLHGHNVFGALVPTREKTNQYCEEEGSDEHLPLSQGFQHFSATLCIIHGNEVGVVDERIDVLTRAWSSTMHYASTLGIAGQLASNTVGIRTMQAVRAILHNLDACNLDRTPVQDVLCQHGMLQVLLELLRHREENFVREALALIVQIMDGGNKTAQDALKEYFLESREESLFEQMFVHFKDATDKFLDQRSLNKELMREAHIKRKLWKLNSKQRLNSSTKDPFLHALQDPGKRTKNKSSFLHRGVVSPVKQSGLEMNTLNGADDSISEEHATTQPVENGIASISELLIRVMQLMCEGHNEFMQNYLREQPDNLRSFDIVSSLAQYLAVLCSDITPVTISVLIQVLETLIEVSQGCEVNQKVIFDCDIVSEINGIIRRRTIGDCQPEYVALLKHNCAQILQTLLESNTDQSVKLAHELDETLDVAAMMRTQMTYHAQSLSTRDRQWKFGNEGARISAKDVGCAFYQVILQLQDQTKKNYFKAALDTSADTGELEATIAEFSREALSVEIVRHGRIHRIHFQAPHQHRLLSSMKEELKWHVNRESPADKIRDFLERAKNMQSDIEYHASIQEGNRILGYAIRHSMLLRQLVLLLTFAINFLILFFWTADPDDLFTQQPTVDHAWYRTVFVTLGTLHIAVSCCITVVYFVMTPISLLLTVQAIPLLGGVLARCVHPPRAQNTHQSLFSLLALYHIAFALLSIFGILHHGYFYCFHLLHIIIGNDILKRVILSVTKNGDSLLWVMLLMVIVIYIYSLVAFAFYRDSFTPADGEWCDDELQCFVTSLRFGLMTGGGLGEVLEPNQFDPVTPALRTIFDLSFFIIITVIAMNVVFGIIVDTFSELRDEKFQIVESMTNECFICSRKRSEFEQEGTGFDAHINTEHNMWAYIHFLMYLTTKDPTELSTHEAYVLRCLASETEMLAPFPINRARSLEDPRPSHDAPTNTFTHAATAMNVDDGIARDVSLDVVHKLRELEHAVANLTVIMTGIAAQRAPHGNKEQG